MTECACNMAADWQAACNWVIPAGSPAAGGMGTRVNIQAWRSMGGQDLHTYKVQELASDDDADPGT